MIYKNLLFIFLLFAPTLTFAKKSKKLKPDLKCLRALKSAKVKFKRLKSVKNVRTPIKLRGGKIGKIIYLNGNKRAIPIMDCKTALALYRIYPILRANGGVKAVLVGRFYSYRYIKNTNKLSNHAAGLGVDIYGFVMDNGARYIIKEDYVKKQGAGRLCEGLPKKRGGRILRQIACDFDRSHFFRSILTPDSDREHYDHFHLSVYGTKEKRKRKYRTSLIEMKYWAQPWVKAMPKFARPSIKRVWKVVTARRKANKRLIRIMKRKSRLKRKRLRLLKKKKNRKKRKKR